MEGAKCVDEKIKSLAQKYNFREPNRGDFAKNASKIQWRYGKPPEYSAVNLAYFEGKTHNHQAGSLEELVENLVKTWEMEASHFANFDQWSTISHGKYGVKVNDGPFVEGKKCYEMGNYNALMAQCPAYKKYGNLGFEESHDLFKEAFPESFPWELLKVLSGPPHVLFTWRHWAKFSGNFYGHQGQGQTVSMYGLARVTVDQDLKIELIEVYFDPEKFIKTLEGANDGVDCIQSLLGPDFTKKAIEKNNNFC